MNEDDSLLGTVVLFLIALVLFLAVRAPAW
jgi:hypothetical protein